MMGRLIVLFGALAMAGCAAMPFELDRVTMTAFEPDGQNAFRYKATAGKLSYPEDGELAEKVRMDWLETYLELNEMCPGGYEIDDRSVVKRTTGSSDIHYRGQCK